MACNFAPRVTAERPEPVESATEAGLRYVTDSQPGIRRRSAGRGFTYVASDGRTVKDPQTLLRIRRLAIPPAWTSVWICPSPNGHIQATGRDVRGRKQYRYHARWTEVRDAAKYERLLAFGEALADIRTEIERELRQPGIHRAKVLAAVVRLLDETSIRIGNEEYRRENRSFGLTTLRDQHAEFEGTTLRFRFRGKSGKENVIELRDRRMARIVRQCQEIPGQVLFQYLDDLGQRHAIESDDVNAYLREISGGDFTAKDFRTWNGTVLAVRFPRLCPRSGSVNAGQRQVTAAIKNVAGVLGNSPAVCRKAYVHPVVVNAYLDGSLAPEAGARVHGALSEEEQCVLGLLRAVSLRSDKVAA
jgi:DNA topoisomerase-1